MTQINDESARLEQLELKMMDLEVAIQQLNDVVLKQYHDIGQLRQANSEMERKIDTLNESARSPADGDEVPPHY